MYHTDKTGELAIRAIRDTVEAALGADFNMYACPVVRVCCWAYFPGQPNRLRIKLIYPPPQKKKNTHTPRCRRTFHDRVLARGALPLSLLREAVLRDYGLSDR